MKHPVIVVTVVGLWAFLFAVRPASAQTTRTYWCLEARVHSAAEVVRGPIAALERTVLVPRMGLRNGTIWPDGIVRYTLHVRADEVLKGKRRELVFARETSDYDRRYDEWREARTSFLWFNRDTRSPALEWDALRLGAPVPAEDHYLTDAPPLFSIDMMVLTSPETILRRAHSFARADSSTDHESRRILISHRIASRCAATGDANFLVLPPHARLEDAARQLIAHPERSLASGESPDLLPELRRVGIEELRGFPSRRNRKLLRSVMDGSGPAEERELARRVLDQWAAK
jgi:hypothetical protein